MGTRRRVSWQIQIHESHLKNPKSCGIIASQRKLFPSFIYIYKYLRKEKDLHFDDADLVIYFSDFASWINPLRSKGESQSPRIQIRMKLAHFWLSIFKKNCNFVSLYFYSSIHWFSLLYFIIIKLVNAVADDLSFEYCAHFCHGEERVEKCIKSLYFYYWSYMRKTQVATPSRLKNSSKD